MNDYQGSIGHEERLALPGEPAPSGRGRKIVVVAVIVLLLAIVTWAMFGRKKADPAAGQKTEQMPTVTVVVPGRKTVDRTLTATGTLAARREMPVGVAGEGGMINRVLVEPGQWVNAGQVLATVDRSVQTQTAASLAAQVAVARSDQTIAQAELDRAQQLVDRGFISKADLQRKAATRDAAAARVQVAAASLREANARNGRLDIRAPEAGLVLTRGVEPGQIVSSGSGVLFRMAQGGQIEMRAQLAEADLASLRPGARAQVTPVGSDRTFAGEVWQVSPIIDSTTRQGIARIALRYDPALRPGGFASTTIVGGAAVAPLLPDAALQSDDKGSFVYIVGKDDKVERRNIKIGQVSDAGVTVVSGLDGTERVVRSAGGFLAPGQKVKPVIAKSQSGAS
ncbi:MAG: efflux RND transporter periplasmic adaptor subunit [Sphingomonas sp.]|jgi:RND family efflux transporter MFP subunit|uniref:efflux RND transporter periplasmic adaptor subunit n=1 Tax=Sphingomonas sp. CD22 TaxID=3100214 RepID=UPI00120C119F|nr:efflux RND transporter periplasmic adaptor subunit [Sphingomonas sp. CD22]MEA1085222.1 efflux RND transporter periplasmic adaptor subunit [Sphingomonas sp. CD22]RZL59232.1 MAG: efflux RND transporter periplasmic adaptor subunit [Sphingomonas sp.]